jgi:hypothetical protein
VVLWWSNDPLLQGTEASLKCQDVPSQNKSNACGAGSLQVIVTRNSVAPVTVTSFSSLIVCKCNQVGDARCKTTRGSASQVLKLPGIWRSIWGLSNWENGCQSSALVMGIPAKTNKAHSDLYTTLPVPNADWELWIDLVYEEQRSRKDMSQQTASTSPNGTSKYFAPLIHCKSCDMGKLNWV